MFCAFVVQPCKTGSSPIIGKVLVPLKNLKVSKQTTNFQNKKFIMTKKHDLQSFEVPKKQKLVHE